jgi:hypothetical protein
MQAAGVTMPRRPHNPVEHLDAAIQRAMEHRRGLFRREYARGLRNVSCWSSRPRRDDDDLLKPFDVEGNYHEPHALRLYLMKQGTDAPRRPWHLFSADWV